MNIPLILHLFGVALGAGAAFTADILFLAAAHDRVLSKDEVRLMNIAGYITWAGLFLLIGSGLALFLANPEELLASSKFLLKMVVVGVIFLNGVILHAYHTPHMKRHIGIHFHTSPTFASRSRLMLVSGSVSVISWAVALFLGAMPSIPFSFAQALFLYLGALAVSVITAQLCRPIILGIRR